MSTPCSFRGASQNESDLPQAIMSLLTPSTFVGKLLSGSCLVNTTWLHLNLRLCGADRRGRPGASVCRRRRRLPHHQPLSCHRNPGGPVLWQPGWRLCVLSQQQPPPSTPGWCSREQSQALMCCCFLGQRRALQIGRECRKLCRREQHSLTLSERHKRHRAWKLEMSAGTACCCSPDVILVTPGLCSRFVSVQPACSTALAQLCWLSSIGLNYMSTVFAFLRNEPIILYLMTAAAKAAIATCQID